MKLALSKREQKTILVATLLAIVIGSVYVMLILGPLKHSLGELSGQVKEAREKVNSLESVVANEDALRKQYGEWDQKVKALRSRLPNQEELPATIEFLSSLAAQTQVKIQTIFPQRPAGEADMAKAASPKAGKPGAKGPAAEPAVYKDVLIQIDAMGGYHQLGAFLNLAEAGEKPLRVSSLRISDNPKEPRRQHIKLVLQAYFATEGTSPAPILPPSPAGAKRGQS